MVSREKGRIYRSLYLLSTGEVEPCSHGFIKLAPHGHSAVKMCVPEEVREL